MLKTGKLPKKLMVIATLIVMAFAALPAGAASAAGIGYVDFVMLVESHPETAAVKETLKAVFEQAEKEFAEKSAGMSEEDKQKLAIKLQQEFDAKSLALLNPIKDKVRAAIKKVADSKGLAMVVDVGMVIYGGEDITAEVGKILTGQ